MAEWLAAPFAKLLFFALMVLAGNFAFLRLTSHAYSKPERLATSVLVSAAALRLALGVVTAVVANALLLRFPEVSNRPLALLLAFLPVRAGLWYLILQMFFDREKSRVGETRRFTAFGVIVSYLLDASALILGASVLGSIA